MSDTNQEQSASSSDAEFNEQQDQEFIEKIDHNKKKEGKKDKVASLLSPVNSVDDELIKGTSFNDPNIFQETQKKETSSKESSLNKSQIIYKSNSQILKENKLSRDRIHQSSDNEKTSSSESNQTFSSQNYSQQIYPKNNSYYQNIPSSSSDHTFQENFLNQLYIPTISTISNNQIQFDNPPQQLIIRKNQLQAMHPAQNQLGNLQMEDSVMKDLLKKQISDNYQMTLKSDLEKVDQMNHEQLIDFFAMVFSQSKDKKNKSC